LIKEEDKLILAMVGLMFLAVILATCSSVPAMALTKGYHIVRDG